MPTLCEKEAIFDPFSPLAKVTAASPVFPDVDRANPAVQDVAHHLMFLD